MPLFRSATVGMKRSFSFRPKRSGAEKSSFSNQAHLLTETPFRNLMSYYENKDTSVPLRYNRHEKIFFFSTKTKWRGEIFVLESSPPIKRNTVQNLMSHYENKDTSVPLRYNRYEKVFFISTKTKWRGEIFVLVWHPPINRDAVAKLKVRYENEDTSVPLRYNRHEKVFSISTRTKWRGEIFVLESSPPINRNTV